MDSYGPKGVFGRLPEGLPTLQKSPTQKSCDLGAKILLQTFKVTCILVPFRPEEVYSSRWKVVLNFNQMFCSRECQITSRLSQQNEKSTSKLSLFCTYSQTSWKLNAKASLKLNKSLNVIFINIKDLHSREPCAIVLFIFKMTHGVYFDPINWSIEKLNKQYHRLSMAKHFTFWLVWHNMLKECMQSSFMCSVLGRAAAWQASIFARLYGLSYTGEHLM